MLSISRLIKLLPTLLLLVCFTFFDSQAKDNVSIITWQENTNLIASGKNSEILIKGKIKNIGKNRVMTSFSISFDPKRRIRLKKVYCDNKKVEYSLKRNILTVKFPKNKVSGDSLVLYFSYRETYAEVNEFLRQEVINIPSFAAGANSRVSINLPGYMESATLNPNITKVANSLIYQNIVPKNGVNEIIKLTESQVDWDVVLKVGVTSKEPLKAIKVIMPRYFQSESQKVSRMVTTASVLPVKQITKGDNKVFDFNTSENQLVIKNKALISSGKDNRGNINRDPYEYSKFTKQESELLSPLLRKIKRNPKYSGIPLYARIGRFVHEFIRYDIRYVGRLPSITDILRTKVGVCTEYANLFDALARVAGIPSIIIEGGACGEYDKCRGHAWNMVYYKDQWIDVDATWDLMSGVVSSSHIYFNDHLKGGIEVLYSSDNVVKTEMDFEMKKR